MRSRSCWTCRGTFRHNLHSFAVDGGWFCDDRWAYYPPDPLLFHFRITTKPRLTIWGGIRKPRYPLLAAPIPEVIAAEDPAANGCGPFAHSLKSTLYTLQPYKRPANPALVRRLYPSIGWVSWSDRSYVMARNRGRSSLTTRHYVRAAPFASRPLGSPNVSRAIPAYKGSTGDLDQGFPHSFLFVPPLSFLRTFFRSFNR